MCKLSRTYIAGLFDGEGWISIRPQSVRRPLSSVAIQTGIAMTHPIVKHLHKKFGGSLRIEPKTDKHRQIFRWTLAKKSEIEQFLKFVYPYLIIKKKQANIMLEFINMKTQSGKQRSACDINKAKYYINEIRKLNGQIKRNNFR